MLKEPGVKKSVSLGTPYMVNKEGQKFALTATPVNEKLQKSVKEAKSFQALYKSEFAGSREVELGESVS